MANILIPSLHRTSLPGTERVAGGVGDAALVGLLLDATKCAVAGSSDAKIQS